MYAKDLQTDHHRNWYDYGARYYDPSLARWTTPDPKSEKRYWLTLFNYVQNNPITNIDENGEIDDWYQSESGNVVWREGNKNNIEINGENFKNIGNSYSAPIAGGGYLNYFQNMPLAISNTKLSANALLTNNSIFRSAIKNAPNNKIQSEIFNTRLSIDKEKSSRQVLGLTLAVPTALIAGEALLGEGIFSTSFWAGKASISAGTQAIINKGDIDIVDVVSSAFLSPGAGALVSAAIDYNPSRKNKTFNFIGGNKNISQFALDFITNFIPGKAKNIGLKSLNLNSNAEKALFEVTFSPTSVLGNGTNYYIKKKMDEK